MKSITIFQQHVCKQLYYVQFACLNARKYKCQLMNTDSGSYRKLNRGNHWIQISSCFEQNCSVTEWYTLSHFHSMFMQKDKFCVDRFNGWSKDSLTITTSIDFYLNIQNCVWKTLTSLKTHTSPFLYHKLNIVGISNNSFLHWSKILQNSSANSFNHA